MRAEFTRRLVIVVGLTTAVAGITYGTRGADPISNRTTGAPFEYQAVAEDSFVSLGARYGIDSREIALTNGLKPGAVKPGALRKAASGPDKSSAVIYPTQPPPFP